MSYIVRNTCTFNQEDGCNRNENDMKSLYIVYINIMGFKLIIFIKSLKLIKVLFKPIYPNIK